MNYLDHVDDHQKKNTDVIWMTIYIFVALAALLFLILIVVIIHKFCFVPSTAAQTRPCRFRSPCSLTNGILDKLMP